jgi:hypothetical protein
MKLTLALSAVVLAGCASGPPMSPQEAAIVMQMIGNQQAANNAMMQNMRANPVFQRQQPLSTSPVRCVTRHIGGTSYTDCY